MWGAFFKDENMTDEELIKDLEKDFNVEQMLEDTREEDTVQNTTLPQRIMLIKLMIKKMQVVVDTLEFEQ